MDGALESAEGELGVGVVVGVDAMADTSRDVPNDLLLFNMKFAGKADKYHESPLREKQESMRSISLRHRANTPWVKQSILFHGLLCLTKITFLVFVDTPERKR